MTVALRRTLTAAFILHGFVVSQVVSAQEDPAATSADDQVAAEPAAYEQAPSDPLIADENPPEEEAAPADARPERVKVHDVGLGYHAIMFRTETSDRYALHGPTVVYNYFVGRRWGFVLRGATYFPLTGRMNGPNGDFRGSLRALYSTRHYGFDLIFGAGRRFPVNDKLTFTTSVGLHLQSFSVNGESVSPVEAITMGVAGTARLEYRLTGILHFGAEFLCGFDPFDMIKHKNRSVLAIPLAGTLSLGLDF